MKSRNFIISSLAFIVGIAFLYGAYSQLSSINNTRKQLKLISVEPIENAPPSLAFATVAMGSLRGILVDILWMRMEDLKEKGQFFDAKQLAEWITILQPRFADVWKFHGWNMAYNISAAMPNTEPQERWKWVKNGYELLRDKGIQKNPKAIELYRELAWVFQHKISGVTDDVHLYYKYQLAKSIRSLVLNSTNETFENYRSAPLTLEELLKDESVKQIVDELTAADDKFAESKFLANYYIQYYSDPSYFSEDIKFVFDNYKDTDAFKKLDYFAKAYTLRNEWKFDIDLMIECNKLYGPVDINSNQKLPLNWMHPDAHAIYWAKLGLKIAAGSPKFMSDELQADRLVFQSLRKLYKTGKIVIYDAPEESQETALGPLAESAQKLDYKPIFMMPDLRMFESYNEATLAAIDKYETSKEKKIGPLQRAHRNMLEDATLSYYMAGHKKKASEIYKYLQDNYKVIDVSERIREYDSTLEQFCKYRLKKEFSGLGIANAVEMIMTLLRDSFFRYTIYEDNEAFGREQMAQEVYKNYMEQNSDESDIARVGLPPIEKIRYAAMVSFLEDQAYPAKMRQGLLTRIEAERPELLEKLKKQEELIQKQYQEQMDKTSKEK